MGSRTHLPRIKNITKKIDIINIFNPGAAPGSKIFKICIYVLILLIFLILGLGVHGEGCGGVPDPPAQDYIIEKIFKTFF